MSYIDLIFSYWPDFSENTTPHSGLNTSSPDLNTTFSSLNTSNSELNTSYLGLNTTNYDLNTSYLGLNTYSNWETNSSCTERPLWGPPVVESFRYYCDGVLVFFIGLIGIIGNVISILVLFRPKLRDCFHQLLIALAFFDTLYIVCGGINYNVRAFEVRLDVYTITFPHFFYPFANIGLCGTIFMTVAISLERFLGICYPLHLPPQNRKSWFYILPVLAISILVNIPKFLESEVFWFSEVQAIESLIQESPNTTFEDIPRWVPQVGRTPLRQNKTYIKYYLLYFRMFMISIIPLITVIFLNMRVLYDLGTSKVHRYGSKSEKWRSEHNMFIILLCIVITFLCCHIPRILVDIYEFSHLEDIVDCNEMKKLNPYLGYLPPTWIECLSLVGHSMGILNSSVNFIIYSYVGVNFRREFLHLTGLRHCNHLPCRRLSRVEGVVSIGGGGGVVREVGVGRTIHSNTDHQQLSDLEEKEKMLEIS